MQRSLASKWSVLKRRVIPVFEPHLCGTEGQFIQDAISAGYLSGTTPLVAEFEAAFAEWSGAKYAVACSSGTAALHLAIMSLDLEKGREVLVPNCTILSDALAVQMCGLVPVFVDVSAKDACIDVDALERHLTEKTVGVLCVHAFGNSCDMKTLLAFTQKHGLFLIEDVAQAAGVSSGEKKLGTLGLMGCFSFYANKLITTGEGGAVITDDEALYRRLKSLRNLGFDEDPEKRFIHTRLGNNYRMSSLQAAMGLSQVKNVEKLIEGRRRIKALYEKVFEKVTDVNVLNSDLLWMFAITVNDPSMEMTALQRELYRRGIETRRFFYPLNKQPALREYHRQAEEKFPVSEYFFQRGLYLPSASKLDESQINLVASALASSLGLTT